MEYKSRLQRKTKKSVYKNTYVLLGGILIFIIAGIFFGIPLLVKLSLFIGNMKSTNEIDSPSEKSLILPPTFNTPYEATNTATISLSGVGQPGQTIEVFLNDEFETKTLVDNESTFTISDLKLDSGNNTIKARAKENNQESGFSESFTIKLDTTPPALEVKEPTDGQKISKIPQVKIVGKTEADSTISVNGHLPIVDSEGNFSYILPLKDGENEIKIIATDTASNQTVNQLKVIYEP
jgi:hypothetical protein